MAVYIFFAEGFEESEAIITSDLLFRAGIELRHVSIADYRPKSVVGSHNIEVCTPYHIDQVDLESADALIFPGGLPGAINLSKNTKVVSLIRTQVEKRIVAAICAAPIHVLLKHGFLNRRRYTCFPAAYQIDVHQGIGSYINNESVVIDNNIITSQGVGTTAYFAQAIISEIKNVDTASQVLRDTLFYHKNY